VNKGDVYRNDVDLVELMFYRDILDTISFFNVDLFYGSHNQKYNDNYVHKDIFSQLTNLSH